VRRLIVNADDFGMTRGVNRAIIESAAKGIVTSTTLMATARAFDDAVAQVPDLKTARPAISVGCHVVLLDGTPVSPPERVSSLLQPSADTGHTEFRIKLTDFARAALMGKLQAGQIEAEAAAQIERIQNAGVAVSHIDCHKHAHMFPAVLQPLLRAAKSLRVTAIRNPFGKLLPVPVGQVLRNPKFWRRAAELGVLRSFAPDFKRQVEAHGLKTPDGSVGVLDTGTLDLASFISIVENLPDGTWEFVCHPGYNDADLDQVRTRLRQSRETESAVLTSPEARAALDQRGIELISYLDL
jgi:predicted glycoside hydrolase/deacetylase ChbG (UPF0249 family)